MIGALVVCSCSFGKAFILFSVIGEGRGAVLGVFVEVAFFFRVFYCRVACVWRGRRFGNFGEYSFFFFSLVGVIF